MKRYVVTIEYQNINRKNSLIVWAETEEEAKKIALKKWGCTIYKCIDAIEYKKEC